MIVVNLHHLLLYLSACSCSGQESLVWDVFTDYDILIVVEWRWNRTHIHTLSYTPTFYLPNHLRVPRPNLFITQSGLTSSAHQGTHMHEAIKRLTPSSISSGVMATVRYSCSKVPMYSTVRVSRLITGRSIRLNPVARNSPGYWPPYFRSVMSTISVYLKIWRCEHNEVMSDCLSLMYKITSDKNKVSSNKY